MLVTSYHSKPSRFLVTLCLAAFVLAVHPSSIIAADKTTPEPLKGRARVVRCVKRVGLWTLGASTVVCGTFCGTELALREPQAVKTDAFRDSAVGRGAAKIFFYGDSLANRFHYGNIVEIHWQTHVNHLGYPNENRPGGPTSLFELIRDHSPANAQLEVINLASAGAYVDPVDNTEGWGNRAVTGAFNKHHFSHQVDEALAWPGKFGNVHIIAMGTNNLDWFYDWRKYEAAKGVGQEEYIARLLNETLTNYETQVGRLVARARQQSYPVRIVVTGMPNLQSIFKIRNALVEQKKQNPDLYPYSDLSAVFPSLQPPYQERTLELARAMHEGMAQIVARQNRALAGTQVAVEFSSALWDADMENPKLYNAADILHPSWEEGMSFLARRQYDDLVAKGVFTQVGYPPPLVFKNLGAN